MFFDQQGNLTVNNIIDCTDYQSLKETALMCNKCQLRQGAKQVVMGKGAVTNKIMFIGEGPGADEDKIGEPFVGRAGQLLTKILEAVNIKREEVYITNMVKCRPPGNRNPQNEEIQACSQILGAEIKLIDPKVIVPLGSIALKNLIDENASITGMRGKWINRGKYYFLPTFHPSYLLRNAQMKKPVWHDFQIIKQAIKRIEELRNTNQL